MSHSAVAASAPWRQAASPCKRPLGCLPPLGCSASPCRWLPTPRAPVGLAVCCWPVSRSGCFGRQGARCWDVAAGRRAAFNGMQRGSSASCWPMARSSRYTCRPAALAVRAGFGWCCAAATNITCFSTGSAQIRAHLPQSAADCELLPHPGVCKGIRAAARISGALR